MDDYIKKLLEKNLEVSERSYQLLQKMHRAALWGRFFYVFKWLIIIGLTVWSYLALQPYLQKLLGMGQQLNSLQNSLPSSGLQDLLK